MIDWKKTSEAFGYASEKEMFTDMYAKYPLSKLRELLNTSNYTLRQKLTEHGIEMRGRGGVQVQKVPPFDQEMLIEIQRDGIRAVADRLQCSKHTLFKKKADYLKKLAVERGEAVPPSSPDEDEIEDVLDPPVNQ